jgi:hypothetical protein
MFNVADCKSAIRQTASLRYDGTGTFRRTRPALLKIRGRIFILHATRSPDYGGTAPNGGAIPRPGNYG